jgi:hypothetical protein
LTVVLQPAKPIVLTNLLASQQEISPSSVSPPYSQAPVNKPHLNAECPRLSKTSPQRQ